METDDEISKFVKTEIAKHLDGRMAFMSLREMLPKIAFRKLGIRPHNLPYSIYEIFYHIVYAQKDILNFMAAEKYSLPQWPRDYWPKSTSPANEAEWEDLKKAYFEDLKLLENILGNTATSLDNPVKYATEKEQNLLREMLLILEHSAYHTGQLMLMLRLLGLCP